MERHGRSQFIAREELLAGNFKKHLEGLLADRRPWPPPLRTDGASVIAARLLEVVDGG